MRRGEGEREREEEEGENDIGYGVYRAMNYYSRQDLGILQVKRTRIVEPVRTRIRFVVNGES